MMDPQSKDVKDVNYKNYKKIKDREICPTKEVDEKHFIEPDLAWLLHLFPHLFKRDEKTFKEVFNCVHCNACHTSNSRYYLKRKLQDSGLMAKDTELMIESFKKFGTPFFTNEYKFKIPETVPKKSDKLVFMGCLSYIKIPRYTLNAINYLLNKKIHFTILDQEICCGIPLLDSGEFGILKDLIEKNIKIFNSGGFKEIICVCPACYDVFNNKDIYKNRIKPKVVFISDYLQPLKDKRDESISIQHLCQLNYRGREDVCKFVDNVLIESGFKMMTNEKHWCCGGGMGVMHIWDNIEKIARIRANDFHGDILTTYCPSCYHVLKLFCRREKIKPKLIDTFELLTE
ncbi:MAG: (Fe-S)-binding protein [Candidatus Lokiarchaeota archaeon]|nr:(Fe-S)-binding protein [Candidatus Lokiarchaeota archaeon]